VTKLTRCDHPSLTNLAKTHKLFALLRCTVTDIIRQYVVPDLLPILVATNCKSGTKRLVLEFDWWIVLIVFPQLFLSSLYHTFSLIRVQLTNPRNWNTSGWKSHRSLLFCCEFYCAEQVTMWINTLATTILKQLVMRSSG